MASRPSVGFASPNWVPVVRSPVGRRVVLGNEPEFSALSTELVEPVDVLSGGSMLGLRRWNSREGAKNWDESVACWRTGSRFVGSGRRFVTYQGQIVIMAGTIGQLEESFDVVGLVGRRHAFLVSVSHYGPQGLAFFPRNVGRWRRVGNRVIESQGGLVEAVEVEGDLET